MKKDIKKDVLNRIDSWIAFYKDNVEHFDKKYFECVKSGEFEEAAKFSRWTMQEITAVEALEILKTDILNKI